MREHLERGWTVLRAVVRELRAENVTFMAGSIAYHAFVSLLPFLVLLLFVVSTFGDRSLALRVVEVTGGYVTPSAQELIADAVTRGAGVESGRSASVSIIGVVTLLWGTLKIFRGLDTAFADIYDTEATTSIVGQFRDGVVVFVSVGLAVGAAALAGAIVDISGLPLSGAIEVTLFFLGLSVTFLPMFYVFPNVEVSLDEVVPGALVAAAGWTALRLVFGVYVELAATTETYGFVGGILMLVVWLYFAGMALLLGAAVNAVLSGKSADVAPIEWLHGNDVRVDRTISAASVEDLQAVLNDGGAVTVVAGERETTVPPPETVRFETVDGSIIRRDDGPALGKVEVRWELEE